MRLDLGGDGFAVGDAWRLQRHLDAEPAPQLRDRHFNVQLALPGQQQLLRLRVTHIVDGRILFLQAVHSPGPILSSSLRLFGSMAYESTGSGKTMGGIVNPAALSPSTSFVRASFSFATAPISPAWISVNCVCVLPCTA
jgi:hypothetical protein